MHDLLEGVGGLEVHLVLADLIQAGFFNLDLLNSRITLRFKEQTIPNHS